ncbi:MAG: carboxypeptidase-like regulatory domain-containing protein [Longimicrobiales bacterium]|nr:carboxypeptidase-like regulatory domain-containing protein [Longimicrobiales bacterium]
MKRLQPMPATPARARWMPAVCVGLGILAAALMANKALAQERGADGSFDLVGTVTDPAGRPLVGAFVALEGAKWGSLTGETGRFLIPLVSPGTVSLTAELIGYETLTWTGQAAPGQALALTLASKPILLEGLTVVADRFESRRRATATSVRWFDHRTLATSPQDNALDFLSARGGFPRVSCRGVWSTECLLVRGRATEPWVWVDEARVVGGLDYLRTIPPHELYMVEVYAGGYHIRAYTTRYMERAAERRAMPIALLF